MVAWAIVAAIFVPRLIESAYRGQSHPWINRIISGQTAHPLEHYLAVWNERALQLTVIVGLAGVALWVLSRPAIQGLIDGHAGAVPSMAPADPLLGSRRRRLLSGFLVGLVALGVLPLIGRRDVWPFLQYSMYSTARRTHTLELPRLVGVSAGTGEEWQIYRSMFLYPFDQARLRDALWQLLRQPDPEPNLRAALENAWQRYETLRRSGAHRGPRLRALRLYRLEWDLDPWARNVDQPDRKYLILEVGSRPDRTL